MRQFFLKGVLVVALCVCIAGTLLTTFTPAGVAHAASSPNFIPCSSTTLRVVGRASDSNAQYYLEADLYANFDSHNPAQYCGTMFTFSFVEQQPSTVGGTLHATIDYNSISNTATSSVADAGENGGQGTAGTATVDTTCASGFATFFPRTGGELVTPSTGNICE